MQIIIAGAGEVGAHAAEVLSDAGHNVTVIDLDPARLESLNDTLDVRTFVGHCAHFDVLQDAGVDRCDLMLAATQIDEVNLLSASIAKACGARKTIVRVHHTANFSLRGTPYTTQLGIDDLICPEYLTSLAIARAVRNPGSIALEEFARGRLIMQRVNVSSGASAVGKSLSELVMPVGVRVATIERNGGSSLADAKTTIHEGDFVTLLGATEAFDAGRKLFSKGKVRRIDIAIMGETATAVWLCRAFKSRDFSVRLFVEDRGRAEELSEKLPYVTVLDADPTDPTTFVDEHVEQIRAFITATDDDEDNILACAQAKRLGVSMVIAVVQRSKYMHLLPHVGIDYAFSPRSDAVKSIRALIDTDPVRSLAAFDNDVAEVYEIRPSKRAKVIGHELRNIKMPAQSMIAAIQRGDDVHIPGAEDQIQAGDHVLVIGPREIGGGLRKLFVSK